MQGTPSVPSLPAVLATPLTSLGAGVRWVTLALGLVIAAISGEMSATVGACALGLAAVAVWQSDNRTREDGQARAEAIGELVIDVAAVVATGAWGSPFAVCLLGGVMAFGFVEGFASAARAAGVVIAAVAATYHLGYDGLALESFRTTGQWATSSRTVAHWPGTPAGCPARPRNSTRSPSTA